MQKESAPNFYESALNKLNDFAYEQEKPNLYAPQESISNPITSGFCELKKLKIDLPYPISNASNDLLIDILTSTNLYLEDSLEPLTKGGFARVFKAKTKKDQKNLALKVQIFEQSLHNDQHFDLFHEEIELNKKIQKMASTHAVGVFRSYYMTGNNDRKIGILEMERASMSLLDIISAKIANQTEFTEKEKQQIYSDLIDYLAFLHSANIAHCDIKPHNIFFVESENKYVLADFGISRQFSPQEMEKMFDGVRKFKTEFKLIRGWTDDYCSPEMLEIIKKRDNNQDVSTETFDLFLNDVYSLGIVFLRISSLNVNKSEISPKFFCHPKIKSENIEKLIRNYPVCVNFNSGIEFQKCQKNESTINFERYDVNICPMIKEAIENNYLPRTIETLMKNQFEIENLGNFDEKVSFGFEYKYEEKKIDDSNSEEIFEFLDMGKTVCKAIRKKSNNNENEYTLKEINLLPLMLEKNPDKRANIFEIFMLLHGKKRFNYAKNPLKSKEFAKIGINGSVILNFLGNSLKYGDVLINPYNMKPNKNQISYKILQDQIKDNDELYIEKSYSINSVSFYNEINGVYILKNSRNGFELEKAKAFRKNKKIIKVQMPNTWESTKNMRIILNTLAEFLKNDLLFCHKLKFIPYYNPLINHASLRIYDFRNKELQIQIMVYKTDLMSNEIFFSILADFLRVLTKKTPFLQEFDNRDVFAYEELNLLFNRVLLNFIRFDSLPHIFFDNYHISISTGNMSYRTFSYKGSTNAINFEQYEDFPFFEETTDADLYLRFICEEQFGEALEEENLEMHDDVSLFLDFNTNNEIFDRIKSIHVHGQAEHVSRKLAAFVKKCKNLESLEFEFIDSFEFNVDEKFLLKVVENAPNLKKLYLGNSNVSDDFLKCFGKNQENLHNLKILDISESRNIKSELLLNFFKLDCLKIKKLDISSLPCINFRLFKLFFQSNLRFHLKELKLGQIKEKIDEILVFIAGILIDEKTSLEYLFFMNIFGMTHLKEPEIAQIQKLLDINERYLYVDVCESKPREIFNEWENENEKVWDTKTLNEMIFKYKKHADVLDEILLNVFQSHSTLIFQDIDFSEIMDFQLLFQNKEKYSKQIFTLEFRNCKIPKEILNMIIEKNFLYINLKFSLNDILEKEIQKFPDSLGLFLMMKRSLISEQEEKTVDFIFMPDVVQIQIGIYALTLKNCSFEYFSEMFSLDNKNDHFISEIKLFNKLSFDFSKLGYFANSNLAKTIVWSSFIENDNIKKLNIKGDLEVFSSIFHKDFPSSNVFRLNISILGTKGRPLEELGVLTENISKKFKKLEVLEVFIDFSLNEKESLLLNGEVENMLNLFLEKGLLAKLFLSLSGNRYPLKHSLQKFENQYKIEKKTTSHSTISSWVFKRIIK